MKARHLIAPFAALTCILFVLVFSFVVTADVDHARSSGDRLSISELRQNEEVVVSLLFAHRTARGREYRIRSEDSRKTVAIFDTTPTWSRDGGKNGGAVLIVRDLSKTEIEGLDETLSYCREVREEQSSATRHMNVRYFREGKPIGDEFLIGFSLPSQLAWYDRQGMRGDPDYSHDYEQLAVQFGVSLERIHRMIPFEMLEKEEPNQPPQHNAGNRTSSSDSPVSEAPSAPASRG